MERLEVKGLSVDAIEDFETSTSSKNVGSTRRGDQPENTTGKNEKQRVPKKKKSFCDLV